MNQDKLDEKAIAVSPRLTSQSLAKQIFQATLPEQFIRTIPAQALFNAIKRNGLHSSADIIEIASTEQVRLLLDFDCWNKSYFDEESFWSWLALTDDQDGLSVLQKIVKCVDLKLIALMFSRHVIFQFFDEATDNPPSDGCYTPDNGRTWINITLEDSTKHFLLGRLMALLFETNPDLFYQLLSITSTITSTELEEESYQDKTKRLLGEGIPDDEVAVEANAPISENEVLALLAKVDKHDVPSDIRAVEPLIYDTSLIQPLASLLNDLSISEDLEVELTHLLNAAIVRWQVQLNDYEGILHIGSKVKGCLNIGLERVLELGAQSPVHAFKALGAKIIYRLGMEQLKKYRLKAKSLRTAIVDESQIDSYVEAIVERAKTPFPDMPEFMKSSTFNEHTTEELKVTPEAIEHLSEITTLTSILEKKLAIQIN